MHVQEGMKYKYVCGGVDTYRIVVDILISPALDIVQKSVVNTPFPPFISLGRFELLDESVGC